MIKDGVQLPISTMVHEVTVPTSTHVVLALNESKYSKYALKWAIENYLRADSTQRVTLLTAIDPPVQLGFYYSTKAVEFMDEANQAAMDRAKKTTQNYASAIREHFGSDSSKIHVNLAVAIGDERDAIVDYVNEAVKESNEKNEKVTLIIGSRDMTKLKRTFVGSTGDYCLHHTHATVIVVKNSVY